MHEVTALPPGSRLGLICASSRGVENIAETLRLAGVTDIELVSASLEGGEDLTLMDRTADLILLSREAIAQGLGDRFERPERIRRWSYEFDASAYELLRRAIDRAQRARESGIETGGETIPEADREPIGAATPV